MMWLSEKAKASLEEVRDMPDMKPIIEQIVTEMNAKMEGDVLKVVRSYGFEVDKERLLKALTDARAFYGEGYADGKADAQHKWIPVTERLPERGKKVLCYHKFSGEDWTDWEDTVCENAFNGFYVGSGERKAVWEWQSDFVTHWMPLPQPPKEDE